MNEKAVTVLDQYDLSINEVYKVRGNFVCETTSGKYIMQEYNNSNEKMETMKCLYNHLENHGFLTDCVIENKEGSYVSTSEDGYTYILKRWFSGEEFRITDAQSLEKGARLLGRFHKCCENTATLLDEVKGFHPGEDILDSFRRHSLEMARIKNYIKKRKNKNYFEMELNKIMDEYNQQAALGLEGLDSLGYEIHYNQSIEEKTLNHGCYNHHNILVVDGQMVLINMMKINYAPQIQDLYDYLRKAMEKNSWNVDLGCKIMNAYDIERTIEPWEYKLLKNMLSYPEKFWKIINYYYNSNKAWYSDKNEEKLKQFLKQEPLRWNFIENI